jgi:hypothetical protein
MKGIFRSSVIAAVVSLCLLCMASGAAAQTNFVDCSGGTTWAYPNISSALSNTGNGGTIFVFPGLCNEDVWIVNMSNIQIGALWDRVALQGTMGIQGSNNVLLYGFDVHNSWGDGVLIYESQNVMLDTFTSNNNPGRGVLVFRNSSVNLQGSGSYSGNGGAGIDVGENSLLFAEGWNGPIVADNNLFGIHVSSSTISFWGNMELSNNKGGQYWGGVGLLMGQGARGNIYAQAGDNHIAGNQWSGISIGDSSSLNISGGTVIGTPYANYVNGNGPSGILVQTGSQLRLNSGVHVSGHSDTGVDVSSNSQVVMAGVDLDVQNNGGPGFNIRGNSEGDLWNGVISGNSVGVATSANSSVALTATASSNASGPIQCDSTSYLSITNLPPAMLGGATGCRITSGPGVNQSHAQVQHASAPSWKPQKDAEERFLKLAAKYHK